MEMEKYGGGMRVGDAVDAEEGSLEAKQNEDEAAGPTLEGNPNELSF